jgi:hypothetical protein
MRGILALSLLCAGLGQAPTLADTISSFGGFTGNVANDFPVTDDPTSPYIYIPDNNGTPDVPQAQWMTSQGKINGWDVKDMRMFYDQTSDTMYVGLNFFGVAGDADGNGVVGTSTDQFKSTGGLEMAGIGGNATVTVGFGPNVSGARPTVVAGISAQKASQTGPGLNGFSVAEAIPKVEMGYNYGAQLTDNQGELYASGPGFEFTINNFSTLPGINLQSGLGVTFYAGSADDIVVGEDSMPYYSINSSHFIVIPEPSTILAWTLGIAGIGLHARRRARAAMRVRETY